MRGIRFARTESRWKRDGSPAAPVIVNFLLAAHCPRDLEPE